MIHRHQKKSPAVFDPSKCLLFCIILVFIGYVVYNIVELIIDAESAVLYRINLNQCGILLTLTWMLYIIIRAIYARK